MPEDRNKRRRREDAWDGEALSTPHQAPATSSVDESTAPESHPETMMHRASTTRRRREDTWDFEVPVQANNDSSAKNQDISARHSSGDRASSPDRTGLISWSEMLEGGETLPANESSPPGERFRLPRFQGVPSQAPSPSEAASPEPGGFPRFRGASQLANTFESLPSSLSVFRENLPAQPLPDTSSHPQRPRHGVGRGPLFRPYKAPPVPRSLEDVRIPDHAELVAMAQIHGMPRPMPDLIFYHFRRGYRVPLDIAWDMRRLFMIGVYPSGLVYFDYDKLSNIPTQWYRIYGELPALYWARILYVKQGGHREHLEHKLSRSAGPCRCEDCGYAREHGMMGLGYGD